MGSSEIRPRSSLLYNLGLTIWNSRQFRQAIFRIRSKQLYTLHLELILVLQRLKLLQE